MCTAAPKRLRPFAGSERSAQMPAYVEPPGGVYRAVEGFSSSRGCIGGRRSSEGGLVEELLDVVPGDAGACGGEAKTAPEALDLILRGEEVQRCDPAGRGAAFVLGPAVGDEGREVDQVPSSQRHRVEQLERL